ncbi:hypothetical protein QBC34DRAFT_198741 [Podospora aff. communis PSN243]|uniref:Uncharacterized protein n=1 Tax=Podospora aff. communis PSN243 TaxID=3040156 RepID=A0AAV9G8Z0_9PEZI|nr:hypothetical protein QBC34DRAFT_198741 [Podospora aff. communis PSN243]
MAKPGGWNKHGLHFSDNNDEVRFFELESIGAEELPADSSQSDSILFAQRTAKIQLIETRDKPQFHRNISAGIRATKSFVETTYLSWGMPANFLDKVCKPRALPWFAYRVEEASPGELKAVDVCARWGPGHDAFVIMFGRYDIQRSNLKAFLSSRTVLGDVSMLALLNTHAAVLHEHPLQLVGLLLGLCESYVDSDAQEQNRKNLEFGAMLGLQDLEWLKSWDIDPSTSLDKSKAIYAAYDSTNWLNKACEELISIGKQYLLLVQYLETHYHVIIPREEVQDALLRSELHRHMLVYLERMLRSQFDSYNNFLARQESKYSARIAEASYNDSLSMKTISYLTMVFFPITFVSAIFSTTIFDFQQWDTASSSTGVISPGWWVFVLSCGLVTVMTLGLWRLWQWTVERQRQLASSRQADLEKASLSNPGSERQS